MLVCEACVRHVLHEGRELLNEGWGYFRWVGPSCSTPNPWPVDPDPRGVDRLGTGAGRRQRRSMTFGLCAGAGRGQAGGAASVGWGPDCLACAPRSRPDRRPGVHSADISEIAVEVTSGDR